MALFQPCQVGSSIMIPGPQKSGQPWAVMLPFQAVLISKLNLDRSVDAAKISRQF
jgi:hypothetical protein